MSELGDRYNKGKRRWGLLSYPAIAELVKVLEYGAQKYASWNWEKGLSYTDTFECLMRHSVAWYNGEDKDPETGLSHMAHVLCNAMFLLHFILTGKGKDDRHFKQEPQKDDKLEATRSELAKRNPGIGDLSATEAKVQPVDGSLYPAGRIYHTSSYGGTHRGFITECEECNPVVSRRLLDVQENVRPSLAPYCSHTGKLVGPE